MGVTSRDVGAFSVGVLVGATAIYIGSTTLADEDRNPIRVKNKILHFESEGKHSEWNGDSATKWRLKGNKHDSGVYEVNAFGSADCLAPLSGQSVQIVFQIGADDDPQRQTKTFVFGIEGTGNKREPIVTFDNVTMTADNSGYSKKLRIDADPQGAIKEVTVTPPSGSATKCTFPADRRVMVELCREKC